MTTTAHDVPRLVATDLDGTLLGPDGAVSPRTRAVLEALDRRGVPVVFTTGRPIRWMEQLWAEVGGHGLAVCSNGGIVYDVARHAVRTARTIPTDVLLEVGTAIRREIPGSTFAVEKTTGFAREGAFMPRLAINDAPALASTLLEDIADDAVVKLLARHEEMGPEDYWRCVEEVVGGRVISTWSSVGTLVEISAVGVTKASTLAQLTAEMGIEAHEVVAFGDMPNDLELIGWAGLGVAVANAHPMLLDAADEVTGSNDEDGVAVVIERVLESP